MSKHTVEKIGGTSMSRFGEIVDNVILGNRKENEIYNRVFVVSAYGGITNALLEHKKTGEPGVYQYFKDGDQRWEEALDKVTEQMKAVNEEMVAAGLNLEEANSYVDQRVEGIRNCLRDICRICSYGHFHLDEFLMAARELLSSVGEAHSAWNSVNILNNRGINALLIDLTGWKDNEAKPFAEKIESEFAGVDYANNICVATGYTKCKEGLMHTFDRGYSEITFSKIACVTEAREGVIHKEFHLSSGDPNLMGLEKVEIIGRTNFDVADQLADLGMEAIHPKASKEMENLSIPIRVTNAFEPEHPGTLIDTSFRSEFPRVEMVTGRDDILAIEVHDPDMVGESGYDFRIMEVFAKHKVSYTAKNTNANTITHFLPEKDVKEQFMLDLKANFQGAEVSMKEVAIVSAIGSNMNKPGFLSRSAEDLAQNQINILAVNQCMRQVNMQFVVERHDYEKALKSLHKGLVEEEK
ncbi:aspartate kinase [Lentisphaera araneosa HTCC2155]|uniref:aspartate kinase n=1 Tax=Lentisphaera araneosa HTCC2155 TaxID=313628 RepID=A6DR71_9BACT|nr:aspartate kinase [Lentisphaera araneosa]EDM25818.1 aspartate kinase [Lentisphaera araneosa HTCC2155]